MCLLAVADVCCVYGTTGQFVVRGPVTYVIQRIFMCSHFICTAAVVPALGVLLHHMYVGTCIFVRFHSFLPTRARIVFCTHTLYIYIYIY